MFDEDRGMDLRMHHLCAISLDQVRNDAAALEGKRGAKGRRLHASELWLIPFESQRSVTGMRGYPLLGLDAGLEFPNIGQNRVASL